MVRAKPLDEQVQFLSRVLTAMDDNKLGDEKMKYVDAYLVHLEKELQKKRAEEAEQEAQARALEEVGLIQAERRAAGEEFAPELAEKSRREKLERSVDRFVDFHRFDDEDETGVADIDFEEFSDEETAAAEKFPALKGGVYVKYSAYEDTREHLENNKTLLKVGSPARQAALAEPLG